MKRLSFIYIVDYRSVETWPQFYNMFPISWEYL